MKKVFQRFGLKLKLLSIGASAFIFPLVGVQHLETQRSTNHTELKAALDRELELQQEIDNLNQQVSSDKQQLSLKDAQLKVVQDQTGIAFDPGNPSQMVTPPTKRTHAQTRAS